MSKDEGPSHKIIFCSSESKGVSGYLLQWSRRTRKTATSRMAKRTNTPQQKQADRQEKSNQARQRYIVPNEVPFPLRIHIMLQQIEAFGQSHIVSWMPSGKSFKVHKKEEFEREVLPEYFRSNNFRSFQRNLSVYQFSRIWNGPEKGAYLHDRFVRNDRMLCTSMKRHITSKKKSTSVTSTGTSSVDEDTNAKPKAIDFLVGSLKDKPSDQGAMAHIAALSTMATGDAPFPSLSSAALPHQFRDGQYQSFIGEGGRIDQAVPSHRRQYDCDIASNTPQERPNIDSRQRVVQEMEDPLFLFDRLLWEGGNHQAPDRAHPSIQGLEPARTFPYQPLSTQESRRMDAGQLRFSMCPSLFSMVNDSLSLAANLSRSAAASPVNTTVANTGTQQLLYHQQQQQQNHHSTVPRTLEEAKHTPMGGAIDTNRLWISQQRQHQASALHQAATTLENLGLSHLGRELGSRVATGTPVHGENSQTGSRMLNLEGDNHPHVSRDVAPRITTQHNENRDDSSPSDESSHQFGNIW